MWGKLSHGSECSEKLLGPCAKSVVGGPESSYLAHHCFTVETDPLGEHSEHMGVTEAAAGASGTSGLAESKRP